MKQAKSRQSRSVAAENKVLACATALLNDGGFESAHIAAISEGSGVSVGSIYHHFGSKEGIITRLIQRAKEETITRLKSLDLDDATFEERLYILVDVTCRHVAGNIGLYRSMMARANANPEIWEPFLQLRAEIEDTMQTQLGASLLERGCSDFAARIRIMHQTLVATLMHAAVFRSGPIGLRDPDLVDQCLFIARAIILGQKIEKENSHA